MNDKKPTAAQEACVQRMDGYFVCDEMAVIVHRLRELIGESQRHSKIAFMYSANDIFSDLVEVLDRSWTVIEEIADGLEVAERAVDDGQDGSHAAS